MQRIIFFDGDCNLCDSVVSRVFKIDKNHKFLFASLQSKTAQNLLKKQDFESDTIVYFDGENPYYFSTAVLKILLELGGIYRIFSLTLAVLPTSVRDWLYKKVAANRYRIFGKKAACRMPLDSEKPYFLS